MPGLTRGGNHECRLTVTHQIEIINSTARFTGRAEPYFRVRDRGEKMNGTDTLLLAVTLAVVLLQGAGSPAAAPPVEKGNQSPSPYTRALAPAEALAGAWDFARAANALAKLEFEQKELAERLATRRDEMDRLGRLKTRIIERVGETKPWLVMRSVPVRTKTGIRMDTVGVRVVKADNRHLTVRVTGKGQDKTELREWRSLSGAEVNRVVQKTVRPKNSDDQLAAGILALEHRDFKTAEKHFDKARGPGANIDRYLDRPATDAFARAEALRAKGKNAEAMVLYKEIEAKYDKTGWMKWHRQDFEAAAAITDGRLVEDRAEKLYTKAVEFFKAKDKLWELKRCLDELKKPEYLLAAALTGPEREAMLAKMAEAVKGLGRFLTVALKDKADFKAIQDAIDAAPPKSLIEIQDDGPYNEKLVIPKEKEGLTLRGKEGHWPVVRSLAENKIDTLVKVEAREITLERLALIHAAPTGLKQHCVGLDRGVVRLRSTIVSMQGARGISGNYYNEIVIEDSLVFANIEMGGRLVSSNSLLLGSFLKTAHPAGLRRCVIPGVVQFRNSSVLVDSIVGQVSDTPHHGLPQVEYCNVFGTPPFLEQAKPGKGCLLLKPPQFVNPNNLDFRLKKKSPGSGKASDGGDMGCRYTDKSEMALMLKRALYLRKIGILKFKF